MNDQIERKQNFLIRVCHHLKQLTISLFSSPILTVMLLAPLYAISAPQKPQAKQTARQQVYAQAIAQAESDIASTAKRNSWPAYTVKPNVFIPNEVASYKRCNTDLVVSLPAGERTNLSRLRYDIRCSDSPGWDLAITIKPDIYLPILMAKNTIDRGEVLSASDTELKKYNIINLRNGYIINPDDGIGLTVKRRIRAQQPISLSQLEQPVLVTRGQTVIIIAMQNGIEARTQGKAMKNGRKGDLIPVKNLSSQKTINAVVDDLGLVKIPFALGQ